MAVNHEHVAPNLYTFYPHDGPLRFGIPDRYKSPTFTLEYIDCGCRQKHFTYIQPMTEGERKNEGGHTEQEDGRPMTFIDNSSSVFEGRVSTGRIQEIAHQNVDR